MASQLNIYDHLTPDTAAHCQRIGHVFSPLDMSERGNMAGSNDEVQIEGDMTDEHNKGPPIAISKQLK